jgi:archaellum component FlaC
MIVGAVLLLSIAARAQTTQKPSPSDPPMPSDKKESDVNFGSPESEMRAKLLLKEEKKQYDENVGRAREASELGSQVKESFEKKKVLNSEDGKRLERLEKLARKIRNEAGGSESNPDLKDIPSEIEEAVKRMHETAEELYKLVEKTPRHVISASVIDEANKLIGLVQLVRNSNR